MPPAAAQAGRRDWKLRRRTMFAATGVALFGAGGVIGWALRGSSSPRSSADPLPEGRHLTILSGRDETHNLERELLVNSWNMINPGHPAVLRSLPDNADLQYSGIRAHLQAGDDSIDIVNLDVPWITEFAVQGHLRPLDGIDERDFLHEPLEAGRIDGTLYAAPFNTDVGLLYYNADDDVVPDPPTTWSELRAMAERFDSDTDFEAAIAMQLAPYEGFTVNFIEYLRANGIQGDEHGRVDFRQEDVAAQLDQFRRELNAGQTIHKESRRFQEAQSLQKFVDKKVPMLRHWPSAYRELRICDSLDFPVKIAPMPGGGVLGGQSLAVTAYSPYPDAARDLVEYLTNAGSQQTLFEYGGFAATRREPYVVSMERIAEAGSAEPECLAADATTGSTRPEADMLLTALEAAGKRPLVHRYRQWSSVVQQAALDRNVSADALQERLDAAIDGRTASC